MHDILRFWLDRGVDGFRMDVVHADRQGPALLADDPAERSGLPHVHAQRLPSRPTSSCAGSARLLDSYPGDRMTVGEVFLLDTAEVAAYYGDGDELHLSFNFPPLFAPWTPRRGAPRSPARSTSLEPVGAWPTWVLSNHDRRATAPATDRTSVPGPRPCCC